MRIYVYHSCIIFIAFRYIKLKKNNLMNSIINANISLHHHPSIIDFMSRADVTSFVLPPDLAIPKLEKQVCHERLPLYLQKLFEDARQEFEKSDHWTNDTDALTPWQNLDPGHLLVSITSQ